MKTRYNNNETKIIMRIQENIIDRQPYTYSGYKEIGENFAGNFGTKDNVFGFELESIGRDEEGIFRYHTDTTRIGGISPLIKINFERSLVYFLTQRAHEEDVEEFESRGVQMTFLNIMPDIAKIF